jgi:hypothetical protein
MLNSTELHKILDNIRPYEQQKISVIVNYIYDRTKEDISAVPIRPPDHMGQAALLEAMYNVAKQYYKNGGK